MRIESAYSAHLYARSDYILRELLNIHPYESILF